MILTCPSCGTQYVVKDGAIPPNGRQVRCAACKHSWHQGPEDTAAAEAVTEPDVPQEQEPQSQEQPVPAEKEVQPEAMATEEAAGEPEFEDGDDESFAEATLIEPRSGPEAEERAFEEAAVETAAQEPQAQTSDWREPPEPEAQEDEFTPFPAADEEEPRRRSPVLTVVIIVLLVIALAAAFWFLAPTELKARLGLGAVGPTPLALVTTHMDRQRLQSGNELLTVTGRVINPTTEEQPVPPLQAQLKTKSGQVVYSWTIAPPARSLPPGASASFNSAEVNVPPGGDELTITLGSQAS